MSFNETRTRWTAGYHVPVNATVGDYSVAMAVLDIYGDGGEITTKTSVTLATFTVTVPHPRSRANPGNLVDI